MQFDGNLSERRPERFSVRRLIKYVPTDLEKTNIGPFSAKVANNGFDRTQSSERLTTVDLNCR